MPTQPPLSLLLVEIASHTPFWVWLILAVITSIGLRQTRDNIVTLRRLVIAPMALGLYSLIGSTLTFGASAGVVASWLSGLALATLASHTLDWPRKVRAVPGGRFALPGSVAPLLAMWAIFSLRYIGTVMVILHPGWAAEPWMKLGMPLAVGALSGVLLARTIAALKALRRETRVASTRPLAHASH